MLVRYHQHVTLLKHEATPAICDLYHSVLFAYWLSFTVCSKPNFHKGNQIHMC